MGSGEGLRPLDPRTEIRRRCAGVQGRRRCGRRPVACRQDDERRAIPRRPIATVAPGRQPAGAGPPLRSGPTGDCRGRPCRKALAGQPEGWPAFRTNKRSAPLSRRASTETTSSTAGPTPGKPPSSSAGGPQRTGHGGGSKVADHQQNVTNHGDETGDVEKEQGHRGGLRNRWAKP